MQIIRLKFYKSEQMRTIPSTIIILLLFSTLSVWSCKEESLYTDVLVVGGGASGVAASVQASRLGSRVILVEETSWLGGMLTSAGVSAIDGNYKLQSGFFGEFIDSLRVHYGSLESLKTGWVSSILFEPSVGNQILKKIIANEENVETYFHSNLISLKKQDSGWHAVINKEGELYNIYAKVIIDATELGDVSKLASVKYKVGMDSKYDTGEDIAPNNSNNIIQDLTYVAILKDYGKDVSLQEPKGYDPSHFACAVINDLCVSPKEPNRMWDKEMMITYGKLPNNKYMINWPIEGNDYYLNLIDLTPEERNEELKKAKQKTLNFIYFIQNELGFSHLGLADDEYPTFDLLPFIPYHRESRRIDGEVCFTLNHIINPYSQKDKLFRTTVAVGDYPIDHHHTQYEGYEELPDLHFYSVPSYGLPLGTMIPKEINDFIVGEKSLSVTNLVNGTTRLQPVVLQVGQVCGILASLSTTKERQVREVSVREVQSIMLENGGYLLPYLDVGKEDKHFLAYQRIGATGILKGQGKSVDWSNETWLRVNDLLTSDELEGLIDFYDLNWDIEATKITYSNVAEWIEQIAQKEGLAVDPYAYIKEKERNKDITRGEYAVMIDALLNPFQNKEVDLRGNLIK